jgi:hypothetical protein
MIGKRLRMLPNLAAKTMVGVAGAVNAESIPKTFINSLNGKMNR